MAVQPYNDRDGSLWLDGKMVPWREGNTHVLTHGLHYASSVFEGERVYGGKIFKLEEHTHRLFESARILGMDIPFSEDQINKASIAAVEAQKLTNGYVRPVVFRGSELMSVAGSRAPAHVAIAAWSWGSYFNPEQKAKGIRLTMSEWRRPAPDTAPWKSKAAGLYMICTLAKQASEDAGYDDALMLDYRNLVAEATGANVFFVEKGKLITPIPDCFLDGITRRTIIELAKARQIPVVEKHIELPELANYEECFLTGTAAEITPVSEIADFRFTPGRITQTLTEDYHREVHRHLDDVPRVSAAR